MKLKYIHLITALNRVEIAKLISSLLRWPDGSNEVPYRPNGTFEDYFWTLDHSNDWKLKFDKEDDTLLEVYHRYNSQNDKVIKLCEWLEMRFGFKIVGEENP